MQLMSKVPNGGFSSPYHIDFCGIYFRTDPAMFTFKNSWGPRWGQAGYGTASYRYLAKNLNSAVVLDVQPAGK